MALKYHKKILVGFGAILFVAVIYSALFALVIYRMDRVSIGNFNYLSHATEEEVRSIHNLAMQHVQDSELYEHDLHLTVIVTQLPIEFRILSFFRNSDALANTFEFFGYVVTAPANFSDDLVTSSSAKYNTRSLSGVLAHEFTHFLSYSAFGFEKYSEIPEWKIEGYADYIARESSFPDETGMALFCAAKANTSPSYAYFRYRKVVGYLLEDAGFTFRELVSKPLNFPEMEKRARQALCQ